MLKVYRVYNDFKHMESCMGQIPPDATSAVWITNAGLESATCSSALSFAELFDELNARGKFVAKLSRLERGSPEFAHRSLGVDVDNSAYRPQSRGSPPEAGVAIGGRPQPCHRL